MNLPDSVFTQHIAVLGKTGSGKSSVMRLFVERLLDEKKPVCIIDPKGDWWGLKSSASGKRAGYPVVIFGGDHADVPLNPQSGAAIAELIGGGNRPCIIDLGGWMVGERTRFFIDFASNLFKHSKGHRWLVIDEVHNFAPQGKILDPDAGRMLHWANRLASEGRGRGLTIVCASQRPQKVHKDFVTCCETLIAMRVTHPRDRGALAEWIDGCGDPAQGKEVLAGVASMKRGEGWVWSPEIGFGPTRIKFPLFATYDSFSLRERFVGEQLKGWAAVDLDEVRTKLASVIETAKANDPCELKAQLAQARHTIKTLEAQGSKSIPSPVQIVKRIEVPVLTDGQLARVETALKRAADYALRLNELRDAILVAVKRLPDIQRVAMMVEHARPTAPPPTPSPRQGRSEYNRNNRGPQSDNGSLGAAERAFLTVLAQRQGRATTRNQIAVFAGYSANSRHVDNVLSALRAKGAVDGRGELTITSDGIAQLGAYDPLPTGDTLLQYWLGKLSAGPSAMLRALAAVYPQTLTRDQIAESAGYSVTSRHVDNCLSALRSRELLEGRGDIRAAAELF